MAKAKLSLATQLVQFATTAPLEEVEEQYKQMGALLAARRREVKRLAIEMQRLQGQSDLLYSKLRSSRYIGGADEPFQVCEEPETILGTEPALQGKSNGATVIDGKVVQAVVTDESL